MSPELSLSCMGQESFLESFFSVRPELYTTFDKIAFSQSKCVSRKTRKPVWQTTYKEPRSLVTGPAEGVKSWSG